MIGGKKLCGDLHEARLYCVGPAGERPSGAQVQATAEKEEVPSNYAVWLLEELW